MPPPDMQRAARQGDPDCKSTIINNSDNSQVTASLQVSRLVSRFGFALETAVVIASLAWGIER
jgi:hypothetical protein